ncbi:hypothetical protein HK096_000287, partial [Nowakowskiella sp. JEL0078]
LLGKAGEKDKKILKFVIPKVRKRIVIILKKAYISVPHEFLIRVLMIQSGHEDEQEVLQSAGIKEAIKDGSVSFRTRKV